MDEPIRDDESDQEAQNDLDLGIEEDDPFATTGEEEDEEDLDAHGLHVEGETPEEEENY